MRFVISLALCAGLTVCRAYGLGEKQFVTSMAAPGAAVVETGGRVAPLVVDDGDWPGVELAVRSFAGDLKAVSGVAPEVLHEVPRHGSAAGVDLILVGTIGRSALIG
jgi:hypothetical protein